MKDLYQNILNSISKGNRLLAVLIDPEKTRLEGIANFLGLVESSIATHIFVGGSTDNEHATDVLVAEIKKNTQMPVILFPGDVTQITNKADGLLFLSLLSGRNPEYLIGKHVQAVSKLRDTNLEIIPTGYILIENGKETSVEMVTNTKPIPKNNIQEIVDTAKAGELLGMKLMYLEAGSGALQPVSNEIILSVRKELHIPMIVGGGIKSLEAMNNAYHSGADMVVIGTAFEDNEDFFKDLKK